MRRLVVLVVFICVGHWLEAQSYNALSFPSANNNFLGASGSAQSKTNIGVDQYSGTAQVSFNLLNLASNELTIPVGLNYIGGRGIRVQDYAGSAGLGWQLNAGGGISRVVRGFPDEQTNGYLGTSHWGQQVASALANNTAIPSACTSTPPTADGEPDIFYVKTPYFAFQFTFDENGNPVFSNNNGLQIISHNFYNSSAFNSSSFEVIDDQGIQYYFGSSSLTLETTTSTIYGTSYTFPTTWYLDKIVSFNAKDVIQLNYVIPPLFDTTYHYTGTATFDVYSNSNYDTVHPVMTIVNAPRYISSIVSSLGEVDFNYATDRRDDRNAARLTSIVQKAFNIQAQSNSTTLQTLTFNESYFGDPSSDPNYLRLRLDNITVAGITPGTSTPVTLKSFSYNLNNALPSRKFLNVADLWGFYNVVPPATNAVFPNNNRNPNAAASSANILTGVTDLTGGTWHIGYELNDYYNTSNSTNTQVGGLRVNSISQTLPTGEVLSASYMYTDNTGKSTGQIFSNSYGIIGFLWGSPPVIQEILSESPSEYYDLNGNFCGYSAVKVVNQNGGYTISSFTNFSDFPDILNYLATANQNTVPDITSSVSLGYKRGLLLSQMIYNSAGNKISEDDNSYAALISPLKKSWAFKWNTVSYNVGGSSGYNSCSSSYWTNVEDYFLSSTTHKAYDQTTPANFVQKISTLTYSADNRLVHKISNTDSKGQNYSQTFYYADDAGIPMITSGEQTALNTMIASGSNRTNVLIHQTDNRNGATRDMHNSYTSVQSGASTNIYLSNTSTYNGTTLLRQQNFTYDPVSSNLVSSVITGGKPHSYVYGYNASLPIVKVENALPTEVYYEGFEEYSTDANYLIGYAHTGLFYYNGNYTVNFSLPNGRSYLIQWWNYSGGKWNFNQQAYTGSTTLTGPVDDIRIFPRDALMGTSTFLPQVGKLSEIDPSGKAMNFEYDGLGRQSAIRDQDKNLLKKICYTYAGQTESCTTTYINTPLSKTFSPSCSVGVGTPIVYTVQAGKYTSTSSQSDADQQAQNDMTNNGQTYANTNGVCTIPVTLSTRTALNTIALVTFTDASSGATVYSGAFTPVPGSNTVISLPGNAIIYNINLSTKAGSSIYFIINNQVLYGSNVTFTNIGISSAITIVDCNQYFFSAAESGTYVRNNCTGGQHGTAVTYNVSANAYMAYTTQADANQLAINDVNANGQNFANAHGSCTFYYNVVERGTFTRNNCPSGVGNSVTYTVPANTYSSSVSQADANQQAINDVNANGQNYANANGTCAPFYNTVQSGTYTRNNCPTGQVGSSVTLTVPAGTYSSTISQADANNQAIAYINSNGQTNANTNGSCRVVGVTVTNNMSSAGNQAFIYFKNGSTTVATLPFPNTQGTSVNYTTVPNGTYTVECLIKMSNVARTFVVNGLNLVGYDVTFTNVTVNNSTSNLIISEH